MDTVKIMGEYLLCGNTPKDQENICVVKVTTSAWFDNRGVHIKKNLNFLKRKCVGFNIIEEDCYAAGATEVVQKIINLDKVPDGTYKVIICNENRDFETGDIDDYDYKLIPYN